MTSEPENLFIGQKDDYIIEKSRTFFFSMHSLLESLFELPDGSDSERKGIIIIDKKHTTRIIVHVW